MDLRSEAVEMEDLPHATDLQHCPPPERRDSPVVTGTRGQNRTLRRMILALDRDTRDTFLEVLHEFNTSLDRAGRIGVNEASELSPELNRMRMAELHRNLFNCAFCRRSVSNDVTSNVIVYGACPCEVELGQAHENCACSCEVELGQAHEDCAEIWLSYQKRTCPAGGEIRVFAILQPLQKENHVIKPTLPPDTAHQDYRSTAPMDLRSEALEMEDLPHATDLQHCPPPERRNSPVVTGTRGQNRTLLRTILALDRDTRDTFVKVLHEFKTSLDWVGITGVNPASETSLLYNRMRMADHHRELFDCAHCILSVSDDMTSNVIVYRACFCEVELRQAHEYCAESWLIWREERAGTCEACGEIRLFAILRPLQKENQVIKPILPLLQKENHVIKPILPPLRKENQVIKPILPPLQKKNNVQPGTRFALLLRKPFMVFCRHLPKVKDLRKRCLDSPKC